MLVVMYVNGWLVCVVLNRVIGNRAIIIRYNLLENKICNKMWANLFAVVLPWLLAIVFYAGNWVQVGCYNI